MLSCLCAVACSGGGTADTSCKHDYTETVIAATCVSGGHTEYVCNKCGDEYEDNETSALGHNLTDWAEKTAATCTEAQIVERHCQRTGCDYAETKNGTVKALGHNIVWTETKAATCFETGLRDGACDRTGCDYTVKDDVIKKLPHVYIEVPDDAEAKPATCTEDGVKVEVCSREGCGERKETPTFALGHVDDGTKAEITDPTCTERGYTTYRCSVCGNDYKGDFTDATGHDLKLSATVEVSCLTEGYELWACDNAGCDYSERREVQNKIDHVFNENGECQSGCGLTIADKMTWASTKYSVTYNEATGRLTMDGGDPGKEQIQQKVKIPAELFKKMKSEGKVQFEITMYKWNGTTPVFGFNFLSDGAQEGWGYVNNADSYSTGVKEITDEMLESGFEFWALYGDLTQREPDAWKATVKCTGFDMDIKFIKPFDINDKSMWLTSGFASMNYSEEKGMWVINDADPGAGAIEKTITINANVFKALPDMGSFRIKMYNQGATTQKPQFGINVTDWVYGHAIDKPFVVEVAITDEMRANGLTFQALYVDNEQKEPGAWGGTEIVTGFDLALEFISTVTLNASKPLLVK